MTADYAALEARVAELEQQIRHILPAKIDGVNYGVNLVHADTQAIRETLAGHGQTLDRLDARSSELATTLAQQGRTLNQHGELLREIVRRLPAPPED
jgi:uncharacterized coiled-coil protein SlyX